MKNEEMAELLAGAYQRQYHNNTYPELSNNSEFTTSKEEIKEACMQLADYKDRQCYFTLLRVFDLIANKRDAGEALQYIKETLEFILKDNNIDIDKYGTGLSIAKTYCNLKCKGELTHETCTSLGTCKDYDNLIHIISVIDKKEVENDEQQ